MNVWTAAVSIRIIFIMIYDRQTNESRSGDFVWEDVCQSLQLTRIIQASFLPSSSHKSTSNRAEEIVRIPRGLLNYGKQLEIQALAGKSTRILNKDVASAVSIHIQQGTGIFFF